MPGRGRPIEDAWTWQDGQASVVLSRLAATLDLGRVASELRTWLPPGANWPLPRLLWLQRHRAETLARARAVVMPKDYIVLRLTGRLVTDPSSWRGLVRPDGTTHEEALSALGLPDLVPPREVSTACAGTLRADVAELIGQPSSTPVFVGTGDYAAALLGTGVAADGDQFDIGGTSEHLGVLSSRREPDTGQVVVPYLEGESPGLYLNYGVSSNGGSVLEWLGQALLPHHASERRGAELTAMVESEAQEGGKPLFFVPYLAGERSPIWDADASGAWIGLRSEHSPARLARAALEGVAFNLRQIRDMNPLMRRGAPIRASGGTARSAVWNQIKADVLASPIAVAANTDAGTLGAALHAASGAGLFASPAVAASTMTSIGRTFEPDPSAVDRLDDSYHRYREIASVVAGLTQFMQFNDSERNPL